MTDIVFSAKEIDEINKFQESGKFHPLTCANGHGALVATSTGLICPVCGYRQTWAHGWIKDGSWDLHKGDQHVRRGEDNA